MAAQKINYSLMHRRTFLRSSMSAATVVGLGPLPAFAGAKAIDKYSLEELNPFLPAVMELLEPIHRAVMQPFAAQRVTGRMARAFKETGEYRYLEWAMMYGFIHWRQLPRGNTRVKTAQIYQKMAAVARKQFPDQPSGYVWGAMFTGLEMLTRGVMHSLNRLPEYDKILRQAEKRHAGYYHGMPALLRGKILMKAPPFPLSIGNFKEGVAKLKQAGGTMQHTLAAWHIIYAEALYLTEGKEAAFAVLDAMHSEVKAPDYGTEFIYRMSQRDAISLRRAINKGNYDRYLYDALLEPLVLEGI